MDCRSCGDLVDFVDVDDAALGLLLVIARSLIELEDDVLHILADVAGLGQSGGIGDGKRNRKQLCHCLCQQSLAGTSGTDENDIGLLELHLAAGVLREVDPLVVVVDRH